MFRKHTCLVKACWGQTLFCHKLLWKLPDHCSFSSCFKPGRFSWFSSFIILLILLALLLIYVLVVFFSLQLWQQGRGCAARPTSGIPSSSFLSPLADLFQPHAASQDLRLEKTALMNVSNSTCTRLRCFWILLHPSVCTSFTGYLQRLGTYNVRCYKQPRRRMYLFVVINVVLVLFGRIVVNSKTSIDTPRVLPALVT